MTLHPTYLGFRAASTISRLLPPMAVEPVARMIGRIGPLVAPGRAAVVRRHQARVRPELDHQQLTAAVRAAFRSYGDYWLRSFRLPGTSPAVLDAGIEVDDYDRLTAGLETGRGVILALPHMGQWEWAGFWLAESEGLSVSCVVEQLEPPELADWFADLRRRFGIEIIPFDESAGARDNRALAEPTILCLLCDRDLTGSGIEVEFFGETTTLPAGPATIALRTGVPLIPGAVFTDGDVIRGVVRPPIDTERRGRFREDVTRVTTDLARELEHLIRLAPEQWHLFQPNWPSDRIDRGAIP